ITGSFGHVSQLQKIFFINSTTGFAAGYDSVIQRTTNSGNNWTRSRLSKPGLSNILDLYFVNEQTGYSSGSGGDVFKTTNSGFNWIYLNTEITFNLDFIHFYSFDYGLAGGTNSKMIKTTNGGMNWNVLSNGNDLDLFCYGEANDSVGVVCGDWGVIYRT